MKLVSSLFVLMMAATMAVAQTQEEVVNYLNFFNSQHQAVNQLTMAYLQYSVHSEDFTFVEQKRQELIVQLDKSIKELEQLKTPNIDDALRQSTLEVYQNYRSTFDTDFLNLLQLKMNSQGSYEAMEQYFEARKQAENKVNEASTRSYKAFEAFAKKYNIQLMEAEENSAIVELNQLNNYQQTIFLKHFKIATLNNQFMDALNGQNITAAKSVQAQLLQASEQVIKSLNALPPYKSDATYRDAVIQFATQIKALAQDGYVSMIKMLEKPENQRTQADVDQYNNIITLLQVKVPELDQAVQKTSIDLLKKFVPKPDSRPAKKL